MYGVIRVQVDMGSIDIGEMLHELGIVERGRCGEKRHCGMACASSQVESSSVCVASVALSQTMRLCGLHITGQKSYENVE